MNLTRDRDGDLEALTVVDLGADRRELHISTRRNSLRRELRTTARVHQRSECGRMLSFAVGGPTGDFSRVLAASAARATEKAIVAQHQQALAGLDAVLSEARARYGIAAAR